MRNFFKKKPMTDRTKHYWQKASEKSLEGVMENICDGFNQDTFVNSKQSLIFDANIQFKKTDVVLDLACGIGRTCKWVAPKVDWYIGIDFIEKMIDRARIFNMDFDNAHFYTNDGKTIDVISTGFCDIVYCELGFQHMEKDIQKSYIQDIFRVLKKQGRFYAQFPRFSFYKDESYSYTNTELLDLLLSVFSLMTSSIKFLEIKKSKNKAYFIIEAIK